MTYDVQLVDLTTGTKYDKQAMGIDYKDADQLRTVLRSLAVVQARCNAHRPEEWAHHFQLRIYWKNSEHGPGDQSGPMLFSGAA